MQGLCLWRDVGNWKVERIKFFHVHMIQFRLDYCTLYSADITALVSLTSQLYRLKYRESVTPRTGVISIYC